MNTAARTDIRRTCMVAVLATLAATLVACGGGGSDDFVLPDMQITAASEQVKVKAAPLQVKLEGCVVDEHSIPRTGTAVRLRGADGRLLGNAYSDQRGVFTFSAPAQQVVSVDVEKDGGDVLVVPTGTSNLSVAACLRDPDA